MKGLIIGTYLPVSTMVHWDDVMDIYVVYVKSEQNQISLIWIIELCSGNSSGGKLTIKKN